MCNGQTIGGGLVETTILFEILDSFCPPARPGPQNCYSWLHLDKVEELSLHKPADRCNSSGKVGATNLARCIARHIEGKINCS